jgi:phosphopantetheinyl transferase (holo-ACP synthase)
MPLLLSKQINANSAYAVWKISETPIVLGELISERPASVHPHKLSEWIVGRILVKNLCDLFQIKYQGVTNDKWGKPLLTGSKSEISITHSFPYAAAILNLDHPCGIDLELPRQKMFKVKQKFLHDSELKYQDDLAALTKIWSAKEVLYKIYSRKGISIRDEMRVELLDKEMANGTLLANGNEMKIRVAFEDIADYLLCYSIS